MRTISVEVDVDEVLDQIDDKDLIAQIAVRGIMDPRGKRAAEIVDLVLELRRAALQAEWQHFDIITNRLLATFGPGVTPAFAVATAQARRLV